MFKFITKEWKRFYQSGVFKSITEEWKRFHLITYTALSSIKQAGKSLFIYAHAACGLVKEGGIKVYQSLLNIYQWDTL